MNSTVNITDYVLYNWTGNEDLMMPLIFVGLLFVIGIPGNSLLLVILKIKHKPSIYRTIIIVLVTNDLLVCGITLPFEFYYLNYHVSFNDKWVCKLFRFMNYLFVHNSAMVLQLMAVERFRRVCRPLKVQMTTRVGRICIMCIFIFSVVYTLPNLFIRGIHTIHFGGNLTGYECSTSDDFVNSDIPTIYSATTLFLCVCSISVLIIIYISIGRVVFKHFKFVHSLKEDRKFSSPSPSDVPSFAETTITDSVRPNSAEARMVISPNNRNSRTCSRKLQKKTYDLYCHKSTKIAVVITVIFVLSYIPNLVISTMSGIYGNVYMSSPILHVVQRTYAINHVVNPFIYGFIDRRFRRQCKELFSQICKQCRFH